MRGGERRISGLGRWLLGFCLLAIPILMIAGRGGEAALAEGDRLAQAQALRRIGDRNFFLELAWEWALLLLLLGSGVSVWLHRQISRRVGRRWLADALFFGGLLVSIDLATWPFGYVAGYSVARRFGLNVQTPWGWLQDQFLSLGVYLGLGIPGLMVIYWMIRRWPRRWWLAASVLGLGTAIFGSMLWPVVIDPLYNEYTPVSDPAVLDRVERLSLVTGIPIGEVLQVDMGRRTTAANAWVAGLWGTRRIVVGDTLLARYSPDQIEAVIAHELGHVVHNDIWWGTLALAAGQAVGLYIIARVANWILSRVGAGWGIGGLGDPASAPVIMLLLSLLLTIAMPLINGGSRWREAAADRYALQVTSNPEALAEFFEKIAAQNLSDPVPPRWHVWLFMSHPPISERIEMVERFIAARSGSDPGS